MNVETNWKSWNRATEVKYQGMKLPLLIVNRKSYNRATEVTPWNEATAFDYVHYIGIYVLYLFCICCV